GGVLSPDGRRSGGDHEDGHSQTIRYALSMGAPSPSPAVGGRRVVPNGSALLRQHEGPVLQIERHLRQREVGEGDLLPDDDAAVAVVADGVREAAGPDRQAPDAEGLCAAGTLEVASDTCPLPGGHDEVLQPAAPILLRRRAARPGVVRASLLRRWE